MTVGEKIRKIREEKGLTQQALADQIGVKQQMIGQLENSSKPPKLSTIKKLASALGVHQNELLPDEWRTNAGKPGVQLGQNIVNARYKQHLTRAALAKRLNIPALLLFKWETGKRLPSTAELQQIADALHTTPHALQQSCSAAPENPDPDPDLPLSEPELTLLDAFWQLNDAGKQKLLEYADDLTAHVKYSKQDESYDLHS